MSGGPAWPPPPDQPGWRQPQAADREPAPGLTPTVVVTVLFGLFGLIPAWLSVSQARRTGHPENRYWIAFGASLAASVVLYVGVLGVVLALVVNSVDATASRAIGGASSTAALGGTGTTASCDFEQVGPSSSAVDATPPSKTVPASGTTTLTMTTSAGSIGLELDAAAAPCATASLTSLAEQGFFDDTICHRETDSPGLSVLQCGDPTGTGYGGPSYHYPTQVTGAETYTRGTVAMANAADGYDGSQFFLVYADSQLTPDYTVVGQVDDGGLDTLDAIVARGNDASNGTGDGAPTVPVSITSITVTG